MNIYVHQTGFGETLPSEATVAIKMYIIRDDKIFSKMSHLQRLVKRHRCE